MKAVLIGSNNTNLGYSSIGLDVVPIGDMYTQEVEDAHSPDIIISYVDEEAFHIIPKCPVVDMNKYAPMFIRMPYTEGFERKYGFDPRFVKIATDESEGLSMEDSGELFDIYVMNEFDPVQAVGAMAWECLVVAPETIESRSWIAHGVTGILYKEKVDLVDYLDNLVKDPILRQDIGTAARKWVYQSADIKIMKDLINRINKCP